MSMHLWVLFMLCRHCYIAICTLPIEIKLEHPSYFTLIAAYIVFTRVHCETHKDHVLICLQLCLWWHFLHTRSMNTVKKAKKKKAPPPKKNFPVNFDHRNDSCHFFPLTGLFQRMPCSSETARQPSKVPTQMPALGRSQRWSHQCGMGSQRMKNRCGTGGNFQSFEVVHAAFSKWGMHCVTDVEKKKLSYLIY